MKIVPFVSLVVAVVVLAAVISYYSTRPSAVDESSESYQRMKAAIERASGVSATPTPDPFDEYYQKLLSLGWKPRSVGESSVTLSTPTPSEQKALDRVSACISAGTDIPASIADAALRAVQRMTDDALIQYEAALALVDGEYKTGGISADERDIRKKHLSEDIDDVLAEIEELYAFE